MIIRSNVKLDLHTAAQAVVKGSWFERYRTFKPRKQSYAWDILWWCDHAKGRRRPNGGAYGAVRDEWAPTYDEWGWFLADLFAQDPEMDATYYKGVEDFHRKTNYRFGCVECLVS